MSEISVTRRTRYYSWNRHGLCRWFEEREEEGQKKYGYGRKNAAYKRDNLMDVLEEVTDAITIMDYFLERLGKAADATSPVDLALVNEAIKINNELVRLAEWVDALREEVHNEYPVLCREHLTRLVPLQAVASKRD